MSDYESHIGIAHYVNGKITNIHLVGGENEKFSKLTTQAINEARETPLLMDGSLEIRVVVVKINQYNPIAIFPSDRNKTTKQLMENYW
jgi:hypothetical protein